MMRVTVEIVPHGDESKAETVTQVVLTQVERFDDDPGGLRGYAVWIGAHDRGDVDREPDFKLAHWRSSGAATLAARALEFVPRPDPASVIG